MQLIDTHCHLDFPDYKSDLDAVLKRAEEAGLIRMIIPGTSLKSSSDAVKLAEKYPILFAAVGAHPHEADRVDEDVILRLRDLAASSKKVAAIGEIGLDYYRNYSKPENQKKLLQGCLTLAKDLNLPVILHNRNAEEDLLGILKEAGTLGAGGVMHCYSGDSDFLKKVLELGMYISFAGNITFEKAKDSINIIKEVPLEKLLLETDSPYITPEPLRGKRNEPANVKYLLSVYANIYGLTQEDIARITTHNANALFHLGLEEKSKISYTIRDSIYLNITNRCTNECSFCVRGYSNYVKGHKLRLEDEPSSQEIIAEINNVAKYKEVVFCGYGEPTMRLDIIKEVSAFVKKSGGKVRLVTNGEGNLINSRRIAGELKGLVDRVSVSLNASNEEEYNNLCRSIFGKDAYKAILEFIADSRREGIEVEVTCLDMIGKEAVEKCRKIAKDLGVDFRLRYLDAVG